MMASYDVASYDVASYDVAVIRWRHMLWRHMMWRHMMWRHMIWRHMMTSYDVASYNIMHADVDEDGADDVLVAKGPASIVPAASVDLGRNGVADERAKRSLRQQPREVVHANPVIALSHPASKLGLNDDKVLVLARDIGMFDAYSRRRPLRCLLLLRHQRLITVTLSNPENCPEIESRRLFDCTFQRLLNSTGGEPG